MNIWIRLALCGLLVSTMAFGIAGMCGGGGGGGGVVSTGSSAPPSLKVSAPNGGEVWSVGTQHNITWTGSDYTRIPTVRLEYSTDDFNTATIIANTTINTGSYLWTIPDHASSTVKVRVSDAVFPSIYDVSDANFQITGGTAPGFTVDSPNGGEVWAIGSSQTISWTTTGIIANVRLQYSKNNFATATTIVTSTVNDGSYLWLIPNDVSSTVKVRVSDISNPLVYDTSDADFWIGITGNNNLLLTSPNGGEVWPVGSSQNITWSTTGSIPGVKLEYSTDGFITPILITAASLNTGSYTWTIPNDCSNTVKVRVSDSTFPTQVYDDSDACFRIRSNLLLNSPNGGQVWQVGSSHNITWSSLGAIASVDLDYSLDNFATVTPIATSTANTGSFPWNSIPNVPSTTVKVRVSDASDPSVYDDSDANFEITTTLPPGLTITSPDGGEVWVQGNSHNITWTTIGTITDVMIEYSIDNFSTAITTIDPSWPNTSGKSWNIPPDVSTTVRVRVLDAGNHAVSDTSDANFTISGLPGADTWVPTSLTNAPIGRFMHTAVWTGTEMIIWGGMGSGGTTNTGARYDPANDTWTATTTNGAPQTRCEHTAVWTGTEMMVWGGLPWTNTGAGAKYYPLTDTWLPITTTGAPLVRCYHSAVWTGTEMIIWGGMDNAFNPLGNGARYNPTTDTWTPVNPIGTPCPREAPTSVWTGSRMIIWGGWGPVLMGGFLNDGGIYDPALNTWTGATNLSGAPSIRAVVPPAVWTGTEMIVWGGYDGALLGDGAKYDPTGNSWTATNLIGAPSARDEHTAVWTGTEMIIWGGRGSGGKTNTGGKYEPTGNTWTATNPAGTPSARARHTAVWTGTEMIIWGGRSPSSVDLNTGGRYKP